MELLEETSPSESDPIWALAMNQSRKSLMHFKLGAVIIKRGRLLGFGYNTSKTHPRYGSKDNYRTLHAEGSALYCAEKLGNDVRGATMIVYRKGGRMSKPCIHCQAIMQRAGIKKVIYTNNE